VLVVGSVVRIAAGGTVSGANAAKTIRVYFRRYSSRDEPRRRRKLRYVSALVDLVVTGATAQKATSLYLGGQGTAQVGGYTTPAEAISGAITVKTTGQTPTLRMRS
jgi:hypothetical protein